MSSRLLILVLIALVFGCKKEDSDGDATLSSIEAGITSLSDVADEHSNEEFAMKSNSFLNKWLESFQILNAYAIDCDGRAGNLVCDNGEKEITYDQCTIPSTDQILNGTVNLSYSDDITCSLSSEGDSVLRTYNITRTTPWGAVVSSNSDFKTDYAGNSYGGGSELTHVSGGGFELSVHGKHKQRTTARGHEAFDLSLRTTEAVGISSLDRSTRIIDGGRIEIAHNQRSFTVALEPSNLTYSSSCCYPVDGNIAVTISGAINTTGEVSFNGCGNATIFKNGISTNFTLYSCE